MTESAAGRSTRFQRIVALVFYAALAIPVILLAMFVYRTFIHDWTVFSFGYDEEAFRTIEPGDSIDALIDKVGSPLRMTFFLPHPWDYHGFRIYFDAKERAYLKKAGGEKAYLPLMSKPEIIELYGDPHPKTWEYEGFQIEFGHSGRAIARARKGAAEREHLDSLEQEEVRRIYGDPERIVFPSGPARQMWEYTQPGRLGRWADVTWDCRRVLVDMERYQVIAVEAHHIRAGDPIRTRNDIHRVLDDQ